MAGTRREFFKKSVATGLIATSASQAGADWAGASWVGLMHSTNLEPELDEALLKGFGSSNTYEADPTKPASGKTRVIIERFHGLGKYQGHATDFDALADNINSQQPPWKLIIVAGGNPAVISASQRLNIPLLVAYVKGPSDPSPVYPNNLVVFDVSQGTNADYPNPTKSILYQLGQKYVVNNQAQIAVLYNGNSLASSTYIANWNNATSNTAKLYDATQSGANTSNSGIDFKVAIQKAVGLTSATTTRALVITPDPFFTLHRRQIIQHLRRLNLPNLVCCFPFTEYYDEATTFGEFKDQNCFALGPPLTKIYSMLGTKAADMLTTILSGSSVTASSASVPFVYLGLSPAPPTGP
jgi:hypothetical protein